MTSDQMGWFEVSRNAPGPVRLVVHGEFDVHDAAAFRTVGGSVLTERTLVVDLTRCSHIDDVGLGALLGLLRRTHEVEGHVVVAVAPGSPLSAVLHHAGVDHLAPVIASGRRIEESPS